MPTTGCILFVSDNAQSLTVAYSRIVDLILSGAKNYTVGVAFANGSNHVSLIGGPSQPSVQTLKQLKASAQSICEGATLSPYKSPAALAGDALRFAQQLPAFTDTAHKELVVLSSSEGQNEQEAAEIVAELHRMGIQGYAVCPAGAAIEGLKAPPWLSYEELTAPPLKTVSPVKTYDGAFTIGDPTSPLVSISVLCYPATRRATAMTPSSFHGEHIAVSSYQMQTSEGPPSRPEDVQRGFTYLSEMVTANTEVQKLMDGEFNGAEHWPKAFELLATVPEVPPWIPLGGSDVVVGKDKASAAFIAALHDVLKERNVQAVARLSKGPRGGHLKGSVELSLLQPFEKDLLLRTPLPYREDFKSYYRFMKIAEEPAPGDESLDDRMDELVRGMRVDIPRPPRNPAIARIGKFIKNYLVTESTQIPGADPLLDFPERPDCKQLSVDLASQFGITEQTQAPPAAAEPSQDVSYQATQTEINIDDLL